MGKSFCSDRSGTNKRESGYMGTRQNPTESLEPWTRCTAAPCNSNMQPPQSRSMVFHVNRSFVDLCEASKVKRKNILMVPTRVELATLALLAPRSNQLHRLSVLLLNVVPATQCLPELRDLGPDHRRSCELMIVDANDSCITYYISKLVRREKKCPQSSQGETW